MRRHGFFPTSMAVRVFASSLIVVSVCSALLIGAPAHASSWNAGHIIDDLIMSNANTLSPGMIQDFLNSKVSSCDTNGTQPASDFGRSDLTHAQYAATQGWPGPPYTCLKDYSVNGVGSAQLIYNVAQQYQINPEVLIVVLQKESSLVTDTWPLSSQYRTATGYGCPDTAPCDSQYYGLDNQLGWTAKMYRAILNNSPTWYTPYILGTNYIQYNPDASCGGSNVTIDDRSTQALYNYTPYQPNSATLSATWPSTVPCGAYGNWNFWNYFNRWFGPTSNPSLYFAVIQSTTSSEEYLQTSVGKYWIPDGTTMSAWGLDTQPVQMKPQSFIDSIPTKGTLGRLLKDDWGNTFFIDNKLKYYIRNGSYFPLLNLDPNTSAQSLGLVYTLQSGTWLGRFAQDATNGGQIWLLDHGTKRAVPSPSDLLYQWGYTPDQLTQLSTAYLSSLPTGANVSRYVSDGTKDYVIDVNRRLAFPNSDTENAYYGAASASPYDPSTLAFLSSTTVSPFVSDENGNWYMLEAGRKHYVSSSSLASLWGQSGQPIPVSNAFLATLTDGGPLSYVVQTSSPSRYWVVDGSKHYIPDANTANAWITPNTSPPIYSTQSLNLLKQGANATAFIHGVGSPYTYTMDAGVKRYLSSQNAPSAWAAQPFDVSNQLVSAIPEGQFVDYLIKDSTGQGYLLANGTAYKIDPSFYSDWGINSSTPTVADQTLARFPLSGSTLKAFVSVGSSNYIMSQGRAIPITAFSDAWQFSSLSPASLPVNYTPVTTNASYLIKSTDSNDSSIWLINNGQKILLNFPQAVSFGYISRGINPTPLTPEVLSLIPDSSQTPTYLVQKQGSGIKLLNLGSALGFPDGSTLTSYVGTGTVMTIPASIFDSIPLTGSVSKTIRDDQGAIYTIQNGQKRWLSTANAYQAYATQPVVYLFGTTMVQIPSGSPLN